MVEINSHVSNHNEYYKQHQLKEIIDKIKFTKLYIT